MAYEMVMPYHLHMPSYFLETFTEYPFDTTLFSLCPFLWTWGESNSRPNEETIRFLHAYLCLSFSSISKTKATNLYLIL